MKQNRDFVTFLVMFRRGVLIPAHWIRDNINNNPSFEQFLIMFRRGALVPVRWIEQYLGLENKSDRDPHDNPPSNSGPPKN